MVSQTQKFLESYWQSRPAVRRQAAIAGNMTLAERLAWQDVLRRHLEITRRAVHVLDVGTGVGAIPMMLAGMRANCTGIDWSQDQLEVAQQRWDESKQGVRGRCTFVASEAHELEFDNAAFDVVLAINVLTQLLNPQRALHTWSRVLKPGGKLIVIEDDRNSAEARQASRLLQQRRLADDPLGKQFLSQLERCPLWQADGAEIEAALTLADYQNINQTPLAGQLLRTVKHRWRTHSVGYMLISAEKGGQIPLM